MDRRVFMAGVIPAITLPSLASGKPTAEYVTPQKPLLEEPNFVIDGKEHTHAITIKHDRISAFIKWDGCCEVSLCFNENDWDTIHVCSIPNFIEELQAIEEFRVKYFKQQGTLLD